MSKRAFMWMIGFVAFGFTYTAAVNVKEVSTTPGMSGTVICDGMWNFTGWFSSYCSNSLPTRFGVLAIGIIALLICGYFAEKGRPRSVRTSGGSLAAGHRGDWDTSVALNSRPWICRDCDFRTTDAYRADAHRRETAARPQPLPPSAPAPDATSSPPVASAPAPNNAYGFEATTIAAVENGQAETSAPATASVPAHKTCPDCAEEVRAAARKCRFCRYIFQDVSAPSQS